MLKIPVLSEVIVAHACTSGTHVCTVRHRHIIIAITRVSDARLGLLAVLKPVRGVLASPQDWEKEERIEKGRGQRVVIGWAGGVLAPVRG